MNVRHTKSYAPEAYSFNLCDTSGKLADQLIGSIPQAHSGITGCHILAMMLLVEKKARLHNLPLIGYCTDSASNALGGLVKFASPSTYAELEVTFVGLKRQDFSFYAPMLRPNYPSIAYPCWDHSSRTAVRNLMNGNISIVSEILESDNNSDRSDNTQLYKVATIHDLRKLKHLHPGCAIKQADITPHVRQNCDATSRLLQLSTVNELEKYIPESHGTQLYLIASTAIHAPFRNNHFGSPPTVVQSLWKGIMIWRRWRKYIQLTDNLTLTDNFISSGHYQTLELLAHAGILSIFLAFPNLCASEYSLRNTGNRGIEAIHGMYRGGTTSLPITSANLSFKEFLSRMNQTMQIHTSEHMLQQISGNPIVATRKKRLTNAKNSSDKTTDTDQYNLPDNYSAFVQQLSDACDKGDSEAKDIVERLAPSMAAVLKTHKQWNNLECPLETGASNVSLITERSQQVNIPGEEAYGTLIDHLLGPVPSSDNDTSATSASGAESQHTEGYDEVLGTLVTDICLQHNYTGTLNSGRLQSDETGHSSSQVCVSTLLKDLQPHREKPSKDRSRRFAAGELYADKRIPDDHDVTELSFWTIYPTKQTVRVLSK